MNLEQRTGARIGSVPTDSDAIDTACSGLTAMLWRQRADLEQVLYRLAHQHLILRSGDVRWLARSDDELARAIGEAQTNEVLRAIEVNDVATRMGLSPDTSLRELAASIGAPWDDLLTEHRTALLALHEEIASTTASSRRLLKAGADATREALGSLGSDSTGAYRADGRVAAAVTGPILLDRQA